MKILVTGSAGFIGSALVIRLLELGHNVHGIDNHNEYYDPKLKERRLERFINNTNYKHHRISIEDNDSLKLVFKDLSPKIVINLAAQAGVRYSLENPSEYIKSNLVGFANILENSKNFEVDHFIYASSSSVYGGNKKIPFSVRDNADWPISLYAATKRSNEMLAHSYSALFNLPTTGLRFFTVYGPWGRPDMALFKFTDSMINNRPLDIYNFGNHARDFTYIDDIINGILAIIPHAPQTEDSTDNQALDPSKSFAPYRLYNLGNGRVVQLMDYVNELEKCLNKKAEINYLPMQIGDVPVTHADMSDTYQDFDFKTSTDINIGIRNFVEWYLDYYSEDLNSIK
ncbi:MAG: capsular biosynthesis protein CpsI [Candidatus Marinimicrobia bacterium]|nr:capsular biosynthesis protein CpsI [Candidatus Neomarinimicrobiota bacterium]|tara:strand:- start:1669 stop:2694 length:1026 start_codon:yes stop_codon:yes gene_type:complete